MHDRNARAGKANLLALAQRHNTFGRVSYPADYLGLEGRQRVWRRERGETEAEKRGVEGKGGSQKSVEGRRGGEWEGGENKNRASKKYKQK